MVNNMEIIPHSKPFVSEDDINLVQAQIFSGMHATGRKTEEFERLIARFVNAKYAKATSSGTTALQLGLLSLRIKEGDEVIIPSYVCQAVMNSVNYLKAKPVLVDIQDDFMQKGCNISSQTIKSFITNKTRAIIVPHMFGIPAELNEILKLGIPVIEDCAQCFGSKYNGKEVGSLGDIGMFSFYATKFISTGQGGMVLTNSDELKSRFVDLTKYDQKENYTIGYNISLTDIQSALGISQFNQIDYFIRRRKEIASKYNAAFKELNGIKIMPYPKDCVPFRYIVMFKSKEEREGVQVKLRGKGIIAAQPVFKPLHRYLGLDSGNFKNTESAHDKTLSFPLYPALTDEEVNYIIRIFTAFLS